MNKTNIHTDILIVGNGIAGLTLSYILKQKGIDHRLLARSRSPKTIALAETLPPSALALLDSLGLLALFSKSASKSFGYHALWGSETLTDTNFFFHHPFKYGLKINKEQLLHDLTEKVSDSIISFSSLSNLTHSQGKIKLEIKHKDQLQTLNGRVIVDATGRNRAVLKKLNISVEVYDRLIASICHVPLIQHPKLQHKVFVESFDNGWGIVSALNEQFNVVSIFTKKGVPILPLLRDYKNWESVLQSSNIIKDFLAKEPITKVVGRDANSVKSSQIAGPNWLAIGDAAISFDPLSSHGISNAVYCAHASAIAIESHLHNHSTTPFQQYDNSMRQIFHAYLQQKSKLYETESRFRGNAFWRNS